MEMTEREISNKELLDEMKALRLEVDSLKKVVDQDHAMILKDTDRIKDILKELKGFGGSAKQFAINLLADWAGNFLFIKKNKNT